MITALYARISTKDKGRTIRALRTLAERLGYYQGANTFESY
jgi:hypothetical protein